MRTPFCLLVCQQAKCDTAAIVPPTAERGHPPVMDRPSSIPLAYQATISPGWLAIGGLRLKPFVPRGGLPSGVGRAEKVVIDQPGRREVAGRYSLRLPSDRAREVDLLPSRAPRSHFALGQ